MTPSTTTSCSTLFEEFNDTELYQVARSAGLRVLPSMSKKELIAYITGEAEPPVISSQIDEWRNGIMGFVLDHWRALETQLTCPAKTKDPKACFQCVDAQVVTCLVQNEADIGLIRLHKKA